MWHGIRRGFALLAALVTLALLGTPQDAAARGGGRGGGGRGGGGRGGGRGGRGGGRSGVGGAMRGAGRGAGRTGGNNKGGATGGGNTAKDWELLREQEERLAMVKERRERLMDLDRKKEQEALLAAQRAAAVDAQARASDVR